MTGGGGRGEHSPHYKLKLISNTFLAVCGAKKAPTNRQKTLQEFRNCRNPASGYFGPKRAPLGPPENTQRSWKCAKRSCINGAPPYRVFCTVLNIPRVSWRARELFSQLGSISVKIGYFGAPVGTYMAPEWANMTYNHVLYPCELFQGH